MLLTANIAEQGGRAPMPLPGQGAGALTASRRQRSDTPAGGSAT